MAPRLELQEVLEGLAGHVYFQPPTSIEMIYPCIMYERDASRTEYAGNRPYKHAKRYSVTVVDPNPDSILPDLVEELPYCSFDRAFQTENLNHYVFHLFF